MKLLALSLLSAAGCDAVLLGRHDSDAGLREAEAPGETAGFAKFSLQAYPSARCLDGSAAGGYERLVPGSPTVVLQLQGGGFCDDLPSCAARVQDTARGLGGSGGWGQRCGSLECAGIVSGDCAENPDFCNASLVFLRFCSGDHWRGTRTEPKLLCSEEGGQDCKGFWFSGEKILDAALQRMLDQGTLRRGTRLILAGRSSGGIGVLNGIDRVAERLAADQVDVRGLLLWSVDVDYPKLPGYDIPWHRSGHARDLQDSQTKHQLHGVRVPRSCPSAAARPWLCGPFELLRRLRTPAFLASNLWSPLAMAGDFALNATTCAYVRAYGAAARSAFEAMAAARPDHGLFAASCFAHTVPWNTTVAAPACPGAGCSLREVFASWYLGGGRRPRSVVERDCAHVPCNSLCPSQRRESVGERCPAAARPPGPGVGLAAARGRPRALEPPLAGVDARRRGSQTFQPRAGPRPFAPAAGADGVDSGCQKILADFKQDGFSVLRNALPQAVIEGALQGMSKILDAYAKHLQMRSFINSTFSELPLDKRALRIFQDNPEAVPKFFRSELHGSPEFFDLIAHKVVRRIASCILKTQTLVLYPVYMGRMNLPNLKQNENGFHQDSLYTYEYFNINASAESMEKFMSSQVNFWAPLKDVSAESGTLAIRRGAENRICRYGELARRLYGKRVVELVTEPSELPEEELVLLDDLRAGDLVVFAHHRPHRGTPNRAPGRVRWSMDWRLQSGHFGTMREESGYLVQSDLWEDAGLVTRERWGEVAPSPRFSERRSGSRAFTQPGGRGWRMELDGSHTATSPDVCVPDGRSSAKTKGRRQASGCHRLQDHP